MPANRPNRRSFRGLEVMLIGSEWVRVEVLSGTRPTVYLLSYALWEAEFLHLKN